MSINQDLPRPEGLFERIIQFSIQNAIWVMLYRSHHPCHRYPQD